MIDGVSQVHLNVSVSDQERSKQFWTDTVGFHLVDDQQFGGERWITIAPPDRSVLIVLGQSNDDLAQFLRKVPPQLPQSPVFFTCEDIRQTYDELRSRGVVFPQPPTEMFFGWWALFCDPDGNRFALNQR